LPRTFLDRCLLLSIARRRRLCQHHPTTGEHQRPYQSQNDDCSFHDSVSSLIYSVYLSKIVQSILWALVDTLPNAWMQPL
jgi:hypothetical protein